MLKHLERQVLPVTNKCLKGEEEEGLTVQGLMIPTEETYKAQRRITATFFLGTQISRDGTSSSTKCLIKRL